MNFEIHQQPPPPPPPATVKVELTREESHEIATWYKGKDRINNRAVHMLLMLIQDAAGKI